MGNSVHSDVIKQDTDLERNPEHSSGAKVTTITRKLSYDHFPEVHVFPRVKNNEDEIQLKATNVGSMNEKQPRIRGSRKQDQCLDQCF